MVDFGAQYSQLIARRIRECRVFSAVVAHDTPPEEILALHPAGLVLSGGPASEYEPGAPALDPRLLELGIPVLGICYGMQSMAQALGGEVARTGAGEFGKTPLTVRSRAGMFSALPSEFWAALPYLATIIVLVIISLRRSSSSGAPACLGKPFIPSA